MIIDPLDAILSKAKSHRCRVVLAEGDDARVIEAAIRASRDGIADPVLVGDGEKINAAIDTVVADSAGALQGGSDAAATGLDVVDPATSTRTAHYAEVYHELRKHKGVDAETARRAVKEPLNFAALMVREGDAGGSIGGAVETTAATVRAALQIIGVAPGVSTVSSFFLLFPAPTSTAVSEPLVFADCAMVIAPDADQLSSIAISSADSCRQLIGTVPRTAMLSFSTAGSGKHAVVTTVAEATALVREARPDLLIDGEIQFDAAFVESVAARKAPGSPLEGRANVFVFPNLDAANIGYKIAQRIGGMKAVGPILQGLAQPANDLSRGCSADDVYALIALTAVQAQGQTAH